MQNKQEDWGSSTFISNATRMTFLWRGYASNWQSAKVRAIVLIVIPPSVITQRHDRITLAVICATYRPSGLWTQMQFYVSFLLCKSGGNYCTRRFTLTIDSATFSQFVIKASKFLLFGSVIGNQSVVAIFFLILPSDKIVNHLLIMTNKVLQRRGKTA